MQLATADWIVIALYFVAVAAIGIVAGMRVKDCSHYFLGGRGFGRWLMIGQLTGEFVPFNPAQLFLRAPSMLAVNSTTRAQLEDVLKLVQMGKIKPVVDRSFSLAEAREAHRQVEAGSVRGRALIRPGL